MFRVSTTTILALLTVAAGPIRAQEDPGKPAKIFTTGTVIEATLDGPWRTVARHKESDEEWPGTFSYTGASGERIVIPVKISTRGLTRLRVCDFPPLRIDFDDDASKGTEFRGAGNLKMVTHCLANSRYEQYYIKEFLAYRIYNLVTERSYRVQGLDLSYTDSERGGGEINRFAFLIEDPDDVAERNDLDKLDIPEVRPGRLDAMETSRFMLFQFMISNLDWSVLGGPDPERCCHNARLIGSDLQADTVYAIPYDLDSSGLVDAHYAAPPEKIRVRNVRQRLYRGFCIHNTSIAPALEEFRALRDDIVALFENEPRLDARNRGSAVKFINGFYSTLEDAEDIQDQLIDNCRG